MNNETINTLRRYSLLGKIEGAEKTFLCGRQSRELDLESAVNVFFRVSAGI